MYRSRPPAPRTLLTLYQRHPKPRPSVINLPDVNPPTVLFSLLHSNLLFLSTAATDVEPLFILEFLHRIIDVFEDFIGGPLLASRIESSYDVVAQLLGEICDAGSVCNTEPNALRDDVDIPGWMDKLLGGVGLPGYDFDQLSEFDDQLTDAVLVIHLAHYPLVVSSTRSSSIQV